MDPTPPPPGSSDAAPLLATARDHPSYDEMILAAVAALKPATGSSKKVISGFMKQNYSDLPRNHSALLTHHLKSLKGSGRIVMSKNSYRLPGHRRKRGRPAKSKAVTDHARKPVVLGRSDDDAPKTDEVGEPKMPKMTRGRGRPPKTQDKGPLEEAALPAYGAGRLKRARGRPPKVVPLASECAGTGTGIGPQDQPKVGASGAERLPVRQRGRHLRSTAATTTEPAGQHNQSGSLAAVAAMHVHGFEYEILQKKVEIIQTKVKHAVAVLKTHFVGEVSSDVKSAIAELEAISNGPEDILDG